MVKLWCTFITPWKQQSKKRQDQAMSISPRSLQNEKANDRTAFVYRHYLFYRALLTLLLKRLSLINLKSGELEAILKTITNTFDSDLLLILEECDRVAGSYPLCGPSLSLYGNVLMEGLTVGYDMYVDNGIDAWSDLFDPSNSMETPKRSVGVFDCEMLYMLQGTAVRIRQR